MIRIKLADQIVSKKTGEDYKVDMDFSKELGESETITNVSTSSVTPTGELTIVPVAGNTAVNVTLDAGKAPVAFTAYDSTNIFTSASHGLSNGHTVHLVADECDSLPGGFDSETQYYVINTATNTFQLSLISGGTAASVSSGGQGYVGVDYLISVTVVTSNSQLITGEGWCYIRT